MNHLNNEIRNGLTEPLFNGHKREEWSYMAVIVVIKVVSTSGRYTRKSLSKQYLHLKSTVLFFPFISIREFKVQSPTKNLKTEVRFDG